MCLSLILLFMPLILKHPLLVVHVGLLKTPLSHLTGGKVFLSLVHLHCTKSLQSERLQLLGAAQMYRQQTCSSNLQMKCKTGSDRWWGQTGKSKEQSNSTSKVLLLVTGGSLTLGCRGSRERMMMMMRGCALVCHEFPLYLFPSVK